MVIMFGGLHFEIAFLKMIGDWLKDSGLLTSLVEAKVTRARRAHQVTASSLHILLKRAYFQHTAASKQEESPMSFDDWCAQKPVSQPQF